MQGAQFPHGVVPDKWKAKDYWLITWIDAYYVRSSPFCATFTLPMPLPIISLWNKCLKFQQEQTFKVMPKHHDEPQDKKWCKRGVGVQKIALKTMGFDIVMQGHFVGQD